MKRISSLLLLAAFAFAAAIWTARVVVDVVYDVPGISMAVFLLDILCAVIWLTALAFQFFRYRSEKKHK